ncbi:uncharacterized protein PHACADRAFT_194763 [Phanerochaete carnosa HHB-10118-sp]|uniref:ZZ-type domain-containing protein n=1 Tax=Phanerochaete carnosa (strain HHB-10118-sp) TaxID=650164 RepID=K5WDS5_PHACS|nr:uncharacterized protein PHACADRAFT_194763 [Phanerochaete carnosa HHB-10118-sp]EKM57199.1 hypothetical protein PHACADRAFT_194763 [Phanerochaete carnosa HHB-10118-sp]
MFHNPLHSFTPLESSTARLESEPDPSSEHDDIASQTKCGGCRRRIFRIRHQCLECPDFSLCQLCISSPQRRSEHGIRHRFFPVEYPWDVGTFEAVRATLNAPRCRGCGFKISLGWHKCLSCPDFALCSWCMSDPDLRLRHDLGHPFFPYAPHSGSGIAEHKARRQQFATYANLPAPPYSGLEGTSFGSDDDRSSDGAATEHKLLVQSRVFIELSGTSVCFSCDNIPWTHTTPLVAIPYYYFVVLQPTELSDLSRERARAAIWGSIQMAASGIVPTHNLFRSECSGPGEIYTLTPLTPSTVPLQCVHVGQGAIPDALADIPRGLLPIDDLLAKLNSVLGTSYTLDTPGVRDCLEYALGSLHDFGEVTGQDEGAS